MSRTAERLTDVAAVLDVVTLLDRELRTLGRAPFDTRRLNRSQLAVLFLLARAPGPVPVNGLASGVGLTAGAVTQTVDVLRAEGLVASTVNPADARSRLVSLTPMAEREVAVFEHELAERLLPRFEPLDDRELATLAGLLARLRG
ncbi:MarR family winged helix-turn-helix transcriptional regulator [Lysobacter korlensis]|uniref:MarR family winged helix-turn-helix transcriptional regulator n=1 Tax=Lysobacter korlensis TaxID=553636 RepID=A0ABV6RP45_9GAMM